FSVTTATGIGFDNNNFWFKAMGTNDYSNLEKNSENYFIIKLIEYNSFLPFCFLLQTNKFRD
ncbi:hypothetical protein, partial [Hydrocoleum sp. CS-953]|uniref:hypothetical protein n=1 Tax=Hydrocoleum sp. CS-953 TaxID=1671698 RepID=UPI001AEF67E0